MTVGPDHRNLFVDSQMIAMMEAMVDKMVSAKLDFVEFQIRVRETVDNIVSLPRYIIKCIEALSNTNELLCTLEYAAKSDACMVMNVSTKAEEQIKVPPSTRRKRYQPVCPSKVSRGNRHLR